MKHAYVPRPTTYNLNPGEELNDLRMSDEVRPLYEHVKKFIRETVDPMSVEFAKLGEKKTDRWSFTPEQLACLQKAKDKAKEEGLWNFFLPDDETGQGLKNLDYAYIAVELAKNPMASETMNCSAPDTGNMEVLERVGTKAQKDKWLKPLLAGEIRSAYAMTEPNVASSDAKNISTSAKLVGDEWVINGEKALDLMVQRGLTREAFGKKIAHLGGNMQIIAQARCEIEAMRLMVLKAAKAMDVLGNKDARIWVSMVKAMVPERTCKIIDQAIQMHGATGISHWSPLAEMYQDVRHLRFADGPDEVHWMVVGRHELSMP